MKYNSISSSSLLLLSLLLPAAGAHAQSAARANVPFAFKVGAKQMPAGTYTVKTEIGSNFVMVHNVETGTSAVALGRRESPAKKTNKLIFHRYGSQYFLTAILGTEGSDGMVFSPSRQEKQLQEVAQAPTNSTNNVEIASK
jgi:hypothetical protein